MEVVVVEGAEGPHAGLLWAQEEVPLWENPSEWYRRSFGPSHVLSGRPCG